MRGSSLRYSGRLKTLSISAPGHFAEGQYWCACKEWGMGLSGVVGHRKIQEGFAFLVAIQSMTGKG